MKFIKKCNARPRMSISFPLLTMCYCMTANGSTDSIFDRENNLIPKRTTVERRRYIMYFDTTVT